MTRDFDGGRFVSATEHTLRFGPLAELTREHEEIVLPFLKRMDQIANLLDSGANVSPEVISEGVELWSEYLHGIHGDRLEMLRSAKSLSCGPELQQVLEDRTHSTQRIKQLPELLNRYRAGLPHGRAALAQVLRTGVYVDLVWTRFEDEHPLSCLARQLTAAELEAIANQFQENQAAVALLEGRIHRFLERPIGVVPDTLEIRCSVSSCPARTDVAYLGATLDELRMGRLPLGWTTRPQGGAGQTGVARPSIAFYCPAHAPDPVS